MECHVVSIALQPCLSRINLKQIDKIHAGMCGLYEKRPNNLSRVSIVKIPVRFERRRIFRSQVSLGEFSTLNSTDFSEEAVGRPLSSEELKALLADSERSKLIKKLSEANQQNRFLKRELLVKEDALVNFKSELAMIELEIQALVGLAGEIANFTIPDGSRKINGKYIQSHLLSRLEAVHEKLEKQIEDVDGAQSQEVPLFWHGVAESVQVMGSFDGWSEGEHLSPEYTGSYTTFSTTLILRRGRYEIKFLVDGEWKLSPEYPTVGEGLMLNNLLVVE
ncbi:hypothetical protein ABFS82_12G025300 [Erythranthe guttata]|uniref:AMP-activated protein kinase glycogen-binding domain-containing protein n=1 Tax=Erythranthe guttata TaxID=4155 RepID=A0A022RMZ4_ERYGU|nr:PREDICTED: protein PTST, chloroplastic [Erythranthe guttata]EYU41341.1 hypothetical protein MIMGU_mgv1a011584mg [Erythranthe guttata]|eukprot:XP_012832604.1 PREDICTED: protein PTST, chloroplastic [Erythranthe guttata]